MVSLAVEGPTDAAAAQRLLKEAGLTPGAIHGLKGKNHLDKCLSGFNSAARFAPWLVLRDLDQDARCASALVAALLPQRAARMTFRVAVRAVEAWLLADSAKIAAFLGVPERTIPYEPDTLVSPKSSMVQIAKRSKFRHIREDIVPSAGDVITVGRGYTVRINEFIHSHWRPAAAAERSDSLKRCLVALRGIRA